MEGLAQILPVAFVLVFLGAALFVLRGGLRGRWPRTGSAKIIEPLEHLALTPQHTLHRVRVGGRELLVATHPQGCTLLDERAPLERSASCG